MKYLIITLLIFLSFGNCFSQNLDIEILREINLNRNKNLDESFKLISKSSKVLGVSLPVSILVIGYLKNDSTIKNKGLFIAGATIMSGVITLGIKSAVKRERPHLTYPEIDAEEEEGGSYSFPSGHTSIAFSSATALSIVYKKWYVVFPSYVWAGTVAYSRLHLGVHYPSDVIMGAIVGAGSSLLSHHINKMIAKKNNNKIKIL